MPEWLIGTVLKTVRAQAHVGSNPTPSDYSRIVFALGMARGLLWKYVPQIHNYDDMQTMKQIELIIGEVLYGIKTNKRKVRK